MNSILTFGVILFAGTFAYLIWATNNDYERAMARRRHPTRDR